ncbi:type I DNA topoisomerase [Candidatus Microgenomates bacterium]|nr:MAG: type I DNA topoisomerase [Candidatus Microgenomates bacterium]
MNLIIVESPTKARTLSRFLGKGYAVEATMGHIKDLPKSKLSVDLENNFEPDYQIVDRQKKTVRTLLAAAKKASHVYLATDPDREGEAISAHVKEVLEDNLKGKHKYELDRIVFHEITKEAVEEAISHPKKVDNCLVDAQVARRVLDRLVGYKLSPVLWRKVRRGLSAGRVQSVAVRLIVEREREIEAFKPIEYWEIGSEVKKQGDKTNFIVSLAKISGKKAEVKNEGQAKDIVALLEKSEHVVTAVNKKEVKKHPYPPFTTSTMTQAGARLFGWSAKKTMTIAQKLYEEGLITYHRTDSLNMAASAVTKARQIIGSDFGDKYLPEKPRFYKTKSKSAQEAHEAIRPTDPGTSRESTKINSLDGNDTKKLYELIWRRFMACQMREAVYDATSIEVVADKYLLRASGQVMKFDGWRKVMPKGGDEELVILPEVSEGEKLDLVKVLSAQKFTQPPARFNEASLIKTLEQLGIGRPSTYAPTISTIQLRNYVEKNEGRFFATSIGIAVTDFLLKNFADTFEYDFTAQMEGNLDSVAEGKLNWRDDLKKFYTPFEKILKDVEKNAERVKIATEKLDKPCPDCGKAEKGELVIRVGRFGKFISCSRFPDCKFTDKFVEKIDMECPKCGEGQVIVKKTKKKRTFFGCSRYPDCDYASWKNPKKQATEEN